MNRIASNVRPANQDDAARIAGIYNHYILNSVVTFEEQPVTAGDLAARIAEIGAAGLPWLVTDTENGIAGYAYASKWKGRCAYRYAVETTVYVAPEMQGQGIGTQLYAELLDLLRARSMHAALGGIALPNAASVALHEKAGFGKVAHLREVGYKFERWIDVGYWEIMLS